MEEDGDEPLARARGRRRWLEARRGAARRREAEGKGIAGGRRGRSPRGRGEEGVCGVGSGTRPNPIRTAPARARLSLVGVGTSGRVGVDPFLLLGLQLGRYI